MDERCAAGAGRRLLGDSDKHRPYSSVLLWEGELRARREWRAFFDLSASRSLGVRVSLLQSLPAESTDSARS
jgi:hypothetical protein